MWVREIRVWLEATKRILECLIDEHGREQGRVGKLRVSGAENDVSIMRYMRYSAYFVAGALPSSGGALGRYIIIGYPG
jgi:hypothetical protein